MRNLLTVFMSELEQTAVLWQLGVIAFSLAVAWLIGHFAQTRISATNRSLQTSTKFGVGGAHRLLFPLCALLLVIAGRYAVNRAGVSVALLNLAVPLLGSLALIRAIVYLLRTAFDQAQWLIVSERTLAWTVWTGVALHLTGLLPEITAALENISFEVAGKQLTLLTILQAPLVVAVFILLGLWIGRLIERRLMAAEKVDLNLRVILSRLVRVLLLVLAVLIALPALGIDVTLLSVFGGALGVGIGFGLQKVASNYVSGFTILLDRSISPGALVTIDNYYGQVTRVAARYIVVRGLDGTEAIVPNEIAVTSVVVNHSYSDPRVRLDVTVQVAYQTDVEHALSLLQRIGSAHPRVAKDPEPMALLGSFGDNGINLELYVWISDPEHGKANVRSDLYREIWKVFQQEGIQIPYPQREIRILAEGSEQPGQNPMGASSGLP